MASRLHMFCKVGKAALKTFVLTSPDFEQLLVEGAHGAIEERVDEAISDAAIQYPGWDTVHAECLDTG